MTTQDQFYLTLDIGNDALHNSEDIAKTLEKIARFIRQGLMVNSTQWWHDENGNTIGSFVWKRY